jgi:hypothetical protein
MMVVWQESDLYILLLFTAEMYKGYPSKLSNFTLDHEHLGSKATPESKLKL